MSVWCEWFLYHILRCAESVKHYKVVWDGKQFIFGLGKFSTLEDFKEHFEHQPVVSGESGKALMNRVDKWFVAQLPFTNRSKRAHSLSIPNPIIFSKDIKYFLILSLLSFLYKKKKAISNCQSN